MARWKVVGAELVEDDSGDAEPEAPKPKTRKASFDPGEHTVDEVKEYIGKHPDEVQRVYDAEVGGKNRTTLTDWLTSG